MLKGEHFRFDYGTEYILIAVDSNASSTTATVQVDNSNTLIVTSTTHGYRGWIHPLLLPCCESTDHALEGFHNRLFLDQGTKAVEDLCLETSEWHLKQDKVIMVVLFPGEYSPADQGFAAEILVSSTLWWNGMQVVDRN